MSAKCSGRLELQIAADGGTYLCQTREIDQGQIENMRGVDLEVDGLSINPLVTSSDPRSLIFDFPLDIRKVGKSSVGNMVKLCPFRTAGSIGRPVRVVRGIGSIFVLGNVDKLQDQWSTSADATASR